MVAGARVVVVPLRFSLRLKCAAGARPLCGVRRPGKAPGAAPARAARQPRPPRPPPPTSLWQRCSPANHGATTMLLNWPRDEHRCGSDVRDGPRDGGGRRRSGWRTGVPTAARSARSVMARTGPAGRVRGWRGGRVLDRGGHGPGNREAGSLPAAGWGFFSRPVPKLMLLDTGSPILACAGWPVPVPHRVRGDRGRGCWQGCRGPGSVFSMARRAAWLSGVSFRIWRNPL